jgi:hypothetical protein
MGKGVVPSNFDRLEDLADPGLQYSKLVDEAEKIMYPEDDNIVWNPEDDCDCADCNGCCEDDDDDEWDYDEDEDEDAPPFDGEDEDEDN